MMGKETKEMLQGFIEEICRVLEIDTPEVRFDTSHFQTTTMLAQCSSDGKEIFLKEFEKPNPDVLFAAAHELRHIWQLQTDEEKFFSDYKTADECGSVDVYNQQEAEVDANAFAVIAMVDMCRLKGELRGMSTKVKLMMERRIDEIVEEMR